jgi:hypothetical protein
MAVLGCLASGCNHEDDEQTPMAKQPDVTAQQAKDRLNNAKIPDAAKRVMGGNIKDPVKSGSQQ